MQYIIFGCVSFAFLFIYDHLKLKRASPAFLFLFPLGCLGIALSSTLIIIQCFSEAALSFRLILFVLLAAAALFEMIYALFFSLPFKKTYVKGEANAVVTTGLYSLCRHPGVIGFFFFYLFLWLASENPLLLLACILFTALDVLHVYVQDRYIFPKALTGYLSYQKDTPFLVPSFKSFSEFFSRPYA